MQVRWSLMAAVLLVAVPVAAQQEASFTLEQTGVPSALEAEGGESFDVMLGVNLTGEGFSCTQEVEAPVNVTVEASFPSDAPPNASVEPTDAAKTFPIPAGEYQTSPYSQEDNATVSVDVASGLRENVTATLAITSEYPGGEHTGCLPMAFSSASAGPAEVDLELIADDPPEPEPEPEPEDNETAEDNTTQPPANDTPGDDEEDEDGIPLPWQAAPLAAIGAALVLRGRDESSGS